MPAKIKGSSAGIGHWFCLLCNRIFNFIRQKIGEIGELVFNTAPVFIIRTILELASGHDFLGENGECLKKHQFVVKLSGGFRRSK